MTRLRQLLPLLLLVGCTAEQIDIAPSVDDSKADGLAKHLKLQDDHRLHVDEPSDLAFADGTLYTVSDRHSNIYQIDDDGDVKDEIGVRGSDL